MKKISVMLILLIAAVACGGSHATTMCMSSDTTAIILDPDIEGDNYTQSALTGGTGTWSTTFSYGTVSGIATCNTTSGSFGVAYPQYDFDQGVTGQYCWCKMLRPARSAWVYNNDRGSASDCGTYCAYDCGYNVRYSVGFRRGVFGSAGN